MHSQDFTRRAGYTSDFAPLSCLSCFINNHVHSCEPLWDCSKKFCEIGLRATRYGFFCIKILQHSNQTGALPVPSWGSHDAFPSPSPLRRGYRSLFPTPSRLSASRLGAFSTDKRTLDVPSPEPNFWIRPCFSLTLRLTETNWWLGVTDCATVVAATVPVFTH